MEVEHLRSTSDVRPRLQNKDVGQVGRVGVSIRAVLVSLGLLAVFAYTIPFAELTFLTRGIDIGTVPSPAGMFLIIVLLLMNMVFVKVLKGKFRFAPSELITVYSMIAIGTVIISAGRFLPGVVTAMKTFTIESRDADFIGRIQPFLDSIPSWVIVKDTDAVIKFLLPVERTGPGVPWNIWVGPMITWILFCTLIFWMYICMITIVYKRWVEHERLSFPLTIPVLSMVTSRLEGEEQSFWRNKLTWVGFSISFLLMVLSTLSCYTGLLPQVQNFEVRIGSYFTDPPWNALGDWPPLVFKVHPFMIGIGYAVPLDCLATVWMTTLFIQLGQVILKSAGIWSPAGWGEWNFYYRWLAVGGYIGLAISLLWLMRFQLVEMVRNAFLSKADKKKAAQVDDGPISERTAIIGLVAGFLILLAFLRLIIGATLWYMALLLFMTFASVLTFARIRSVVGIPTNMGGAPIGMDWMIFDWSTVGRGGAVGVGFIHHMHLSTFPSEMATAFEAYKMADEVKLKRTSLTKALILAFVFALTLAFVFYLRIMHYYGFYGIDSSYTRIPSQSWSFDPAFWKEGESLLTFSRTLTVWGGAGVGVVFTMLLMFVRTTFIWWPIEPAAFLAACGSDVLQANAGSFLVIWFIKFLIFRYGGVSVYKKLMPLFLGLAIGYIVYNSIANILGLPGGWTALGHAF